MLQNDCYQLGEVIKTHGLNGEVNIGLDVDFPDDYKNLESVFLKKEGKLDPFFIDTLQINGTKAIVKFEEVDSLNEAKKLVKSELFLPLTLLSKLSKGEFYFRQIVASVNYDSGNDVLDFLHGYVNYQIEHHLWPRMPMRLYRHAHPEVVELCRKYNIPMIKDNVFKRLGKLLQLMVGKSHNYKMSTEKISRSGS